MGNLRDYCTLLGVQPGASLQEIDQAYVNLLHDLHPQRSSDDPRQRQKAQARAREITEAYGELKKFSRKYREQPFPFDELDAVLPAAQAASPRSEGTARQGSPTAPGKLLQRARVPLLLVLSVATLVFGMRVMSRPSAVSTEKGPPQRSTDALAALGRGGAAASPATPAGEPDPHKAAGAAATQPSVTPPVAVKPTANPPPVVKPDRHPTPVTKVVRSPSPPPALCGAVAETADRAVQHATVVRRAAERGDSVAQGRLGYLYMAGKGVPQDDREAALWYRKAADQGHAGAQDWLGHLYETGRGVPQDVGTAALWYRKAAEQGDAEAQMNLALLYAQGKGVARNMKEALAWCRKAAEQGNGEAQRALKIWSEQ